MGLLKYNQDVYPHISLSNFYGKAFHLSVTLENKELWAVKLLNMDASLVALERKYIVLELEEYKFHA